MSEKDAEMKLIMHLKMQRDLINLIRVLDSCLNNPDEFIFYAKKKQMLSESTCN